MKLLPIQEAIAMLRGIIMVLALAACGAAAANPCTGPPPQGVPAAHPSQTAAEASNREVVNELIEQAINQQRFEVVDRLLADDIVEHEYPHEMSSGAAREGTAIAIALRSNRRLPRRHRRQNLADEMAPGMTLPVDQYRIHPNRGQHRQEIVTGIEIGHQEPPCICAARMRSTVSVSRLAVGAMP